MTLSVFNMDQVREDAAQWAPDQKHPQCGFLTLDGLAQQLARLDFTPAACVKGNLEHEHLFNENSDKNALTWMKEHIKGKWNLQVFYYGLRPRMFFEYEDEALLFALTFG